MLRNVKKTRVYGGTTDKTTIALLNIHGVTRPSGRHVTVVE